MAKLLKLKRDIVLDSSNIVFCNGSKDSRFIDTIQTITKTIEIPAADTWYDTGISGADLANGTYIFEAYIYANYNYIYDERLSGVLSWYKETTNSNNYDEIPLSKSGHARNNHDIKLRVLRHSSNTGNIHNLTLQICDSIFWNRAATVIFKFRRMI